MDARIRRAIEEQVAREPFAQKFNMRLVDLEKGYSKVQMTFTEDMQNLFGMAHGGAIFALIDEAFETASNSHGTMAVALSMSLNYLAAAAPGSTLTAEARELNCTRKTATYEIKVHDHSGLLIASCQALVYRKGVPLPFLEESAS